MGDRGDRISKVTHALVQITAELLMRSGADDDGIAAETLTALGCAYASACKICDIKWEDAEPIIRKSFDAHISANSKGGSA